jgi:hypothetical protein
MLRMSTRAVIAALGHPGAFAPLLRGPYDVLTESLCRTFWE